MGGLSQDRRTLLSEPQFPYLDDTGRVMQVDAKGLGTPAFFSASVLRHPLQAPTCLTLAFSAIFRSAVE